MGVSCSRNLSGYRTIALEKLRDAVTCLARTVSIWIDFNGSPLTMPLRARVPLANVPRNKQWASAPRSFVAVDTAGFIC